MTLELDYRVCDEKDIDNAILKLLDEKNDVYEIQIKNLYPSFFITRYDMEMDGVRGMEMKWHGTIRCDYKKFVDTIREVADHQILLVSGCGLDGTVKIEG